MDIKYFIFLKHKSKMAFLLVTFLMCLTSAAQAQMELRRVVKDGYPIVNSKIMGDFQNYGSITILEGDGCSQELPSPEIFFDGFGNLHVVEMANDLIINANENFTLNQVKLNILVDAGISVDGVEFNFYTDSGSGPGTEIGSTNMVAPTTIENIGDIFGLDRLRITVDLESPFLFSGGPVETLAWIGVKINYAGSSSYLEVTDNLNSPYEAYFFNESTNTWHPFSSIQGFNSIVDGIISFIGECAEIEACTGSPVSGDINSSEIFGVCQGEPINLSVIGQTSLGGILYQWQQKSPNDDEWTDIDGANNPVLNLPQGIEEATDFRFYVECENSGDFATTNIVSVIIQCYCAPSSSCAIGYNINLVSLTGESVTLSNPSSCSPGGYGNYTNLTPPDLFPGAGYDLIVGENSLAPIFGNAKVWIDFDQNGEFGEEEEVASTYGLGLTNTNIFHITIPGSIDPGIYRMRIRTSYRNGMNFNSCMTVTSGETEDYSIKILELEGSCIGTPTAGIIEDDFAVCPDNAFSLSVIGASTPVNGLERIWQKSDNGEDSWIDMEGAASSTYVVRSGIDEPTFFRYKVSCNNSGETSFSEILEVNIKQPTECYCIPKSSCDIYQAITNVTLEGESITLDNDSGCVGQGYNDFTHLSAPDLFPGEFYNLTVSTDYDFAYLQEVKVWIDFNRNGVFDLDEEIANTEGEGLPSNSSITFNFVVANQLEPGEYRMRVRLVYNENNFDPCSYEEHGETEDYLLKILPIFDCEEANAGIPSQDTFAVCPDETFQLSVSEASGPGIGLERIWQSKLSNESDWANIEGATTRTYIVEDGIDAPMDYRYMVTCTINGESDISDPILVTINPPTRCYCIPEFPGQIVPIVLVQMEEENGDLLINNPSANHADNPQPWEDFTNITAELERGGIYEMAVKANTGFTVPAKITVYVDWNQDGVFSTNEADGEIYYLPDLMNSNGNDSRKSVGQIEVPQSALLGYTQMRVMSKHNFVADPCNTSGSGQAEDYSIMVSGIVSIEENDFASFSYYPNPTNDHLILNAKNEIERVKIHNIVGQKILDVEPQSLEIQLNTEGFSAGAYLMTVTVNGNQRIFNIIKK